MSAPNEWEPFNIDPVEDQLVALVKAAVDSPSRPVQVLGKYSTQEATSPRVHLVLNTRQVQGQRYNLNLPFDQARLQPYNVWYFALSVEITTQREQNGVLHRELVATSRLALQYYSLKKNWTDAINALAPYHTIIDIGELEASELTLDDQGLLDTTTLNFTGMIQIDASAWPVTETVPPVPQPEITTIDFTGIPMFWFVTEGAGRYFVISGAANRYALWFDTGTEVQPDASSDGVTDYLGVTVATDITPDDAASAAGNSLAGTGQFNADSLGAVTTAADAVNGARVPAVAATSGAIVTIIQQGRD